MGERLITTRLTALALFAVSATIALIGLSGSVAAAQGPTGIEVVSIEQSCASNTGRLDITLENTSDATVTTSVMIDNVDRAVTLDPATQETVTITGRNDGLRSIRVGDQDVAEVLFRCSGEYRVDDQIESAIDIRTLDYDGDGISGPNSRFLNGGRATLQPGEPGDCLFGPASAWLRVTAPGPSVQISLADNPVDPRMIGAAVYSGPAEFVGFDQLTRLSCIEPTTTAGFGTTLGDTLWIQLSGEGLGNGNRSPDVTVQLDQALTFAATAECQGGTGIVEVSMTNSTGTDLVVPVALSGQGSSIDRSVEVKSGETNSVRISGRKSGVYNVSAYGADRGPAAFVDCSPHTGLNDNIATATELSFVNNSAYVSETQGLLYGHQPEELEAPDRLCFSLGLKGSAWYTFVATDEIVHFDGDDDAFVSLWRSTVDNPTNLDELESLTCADAQSNTTARVVPGERYWFALTEKIHRDLWVTTGPAPLNDQLSDARPLLTDDLVPGLELTLDPGESTSCFRGGSLWWTWTADRADASELQVAAVPFVVEGVGYEGDASLGTLAEIFTSDVADPAISDLVSVGCLGSLIDPPQLEPGRKYWIAASSWRGESVAISVGPTPLDVTASVTCTAAGIAQIDWTILSQSANDLPFELVLRAAGVDKPQIRNGVIEAGATKKVSVSGRSDGTYSWALRSSTFGAGEPVPTILVDCTAGNAPVTVRVSCLAGAGRIDVFVDVPLVNQLYVVLTNGSTELVRETRSRIEGVQRFTITGRRDGDWSIRVTDGFAGGLLLIEETVVVECAEPG